MKLRTATVLQFHTQNTASTTAVFGFCLTQKDPFLLVAACLLSLSLHRFHHALWSSPLCCLDEPIGMCCIVTRSMSRKRLILVNLATFSNSRTPPPRCTCLLDTLTQGVVGQCDTQVTDYSTCLSTNVAGCAFCAGNLVASSVAFVCDTAVPVYCELIDCCSECATQAADLRDCTLGDQGLNCDTSCDGIDTGGGGAVGDGNLSLIACQTSVLAFDTCQVDNGDPCSNCEPLQDDNNALSCSDVGKIKDILGTGCCGVCTDTATTFANCLDDALCDSGGSRTMSVVGLVWATLAAAVYVAL